MSNFGTKIAQLPLKSVTISIFLKSAIGKLLHMKFKTSDNKNANCLFADRCLGYRVNKSEHVQRGSPSSNNSGGSHL